MKRLLLLLLALSPAMGLLAQSRLVDLTSQRQPARVSVSALYQRYEEEGQDVSELSFPLTAFVPLGQRANLSLWASQAMARGKDLEQLTGLSDVQVALSYQQRLAASSVVFSTRLNLPSGKRGLTADEFETSRVLSQNPFDFRVPNFGQGFNASVGATWAVPVSEELVMGLGVSYQFKGPYNPVSGARDDLKPGDEILLTAGLDYRLAPTASISGDVTYTLYAADKAGEQEVYGAGDKLAALVRLQKYVGYNQLHLLVQYRNRSKSSVLAGAELVTEAERTLPNQLDASGRYRMRVAGVHYVSLLLQGRFYGETKVYERRDLVDVGLIPELALSQHFRLLGRILGTFGSFSGLTAGAGVEMVL